MKKSEQPEMRLDEMRMDSDIFAKICKALAHPARIKIIEHLKMIDQCVCGEIVKILPLAQSTVSQHLKCLKEAGLIKGEVEGPCTCYFLNKDVLKQFKKMAGVL
jgi:ArsR family transcriptional regulator